MAERDDAAADLLRRVARRDSSAFEEFYDGHRRYVRALLHPIVAMDSDDVTQEVFLQVWLRASQYDPLRGTPRAWLRTIARTRALDRLRRRRDRPGSESAAGAVERLEDPAREVEDDEELRRAVRDLPERERAVVDLCFYQDRTHAEAAVTLGQPLGTVKSRLRAALHRLKAAIADRGVIGRPARGLSDSRRRG